MARCHCHPIRGLTWWSQGANESTVYGAESIVETSPAANKRERLPTGRTVEQSRGPAARLCFSPIETNDVGPVNKETEKAQQGVEGEGTWEGGIT